MPLMCSASAAGGLFFRDENAALRRARAGALHGFHVGRADLVKVMIIVVNVGPKIVPLSAGASMSGNSRSGTAFSWYPVAGCPAISTPSMRSCCTSRQTSERLVPISSAIFVPLTTTVALSVSSRTIRPRRKSVLCGAGSCGRGRLAREPLPDPGLVVSFLMQGIMRESARKNKWRR